MIDKVLFIGIKPKFLDLILIGQKTIELRKSKPNIKIGGKVLLYATSPQKEAVGTANVKQIIRLEKEEFWRGYGRKTGISKSFFDEYYKGKKEAIGIVLCNVAPFIAPIDISGIRKGAPSLKLFQGYQYISHEELGRIKDRTGATLGGEFIKD